MAGSEAALTEALPFVDIDHEDTWRWLERHAPDALIKAKSPHLDRGHIYHSNRKLTRSLATAIYTAVDEDFVPLYGGIRYESRLEKGECWAVFADRPDTHVELINATAIQPSNPDLQQWAQTWGVTIH